MAILTAWLEKAKVLSVDMRLLPRPEWRSLQGRYPHAHLMREEIASPVRPLGFEPGNRPMIEAGPDHFVRAFE